MKLVPTIIIFILLSTSQLYAAPLHIGLSLGLTGKYKQMSDMAEKAFRLWETQINEQGGILGRQVAVEIKDDQSDQNRAREIYRKMVDSEKFDFLFPPYSSGLTTAILPITEPHQFPMLTYGAAADTIWQQGYDYVFGVYPPASKYSLGFLELILTAGLERVAVLSSDDPFGMNIGNGADKWINRLGLIPTGRIVFQKGKADYQKMVRKIRDAGAEAVVMCGHFNEAVGLRRAMADIGWTPSAYWASAGPVIGAYHVVLGEYAEGSFSSTQWKYYSKLPYPGSKEFYRDFKQAYKIEPSYHAATAYAAGNILKYAIEHARSFERKKVRDQLASMDLITMLGRYGVDRTGVQIRYFHLITQWQDNKQEVVWPPELSTAKPRIGQQ